MTIENKITRGEATPEESIRFYESQLPKEVLERAREIADCGEMYIEYLIEQYQLRLGEKQK